MSEPKEFDVFLCHNSKDKPEVKKIAQLLKQNGIKPWLDEWELRPGFRWQPELERQIENIKAAAVFIGNSGLGPWQEEEISAILRQFKTQKHPVIPVLLVNAPEKPALPIFLAERIWVDFRDSQSNPMEKLIWGITGTKPSENPAQISETASRKSLQIPYWGITGTKPNKNPAQISETASRKSPQFSRRLYQHYNPMTGTLTYIGSDLALDLENDRIIDL
ncbi:MAG: toll/interleukin-1 receptor domain-containing protein [Microcoleaceae cyanobacterium]